MYIVGFRHNGNGIDWLREPISIVSNQHIKDAESEAGAECDAVIRRRGIMRCVYGKVPERKYIDVRIRFICKR